MQSRNFFPFGVNFNILVDSVFIAQPKIDASSIPPMAFFLITQASNPLITQDSNHLIAE